MAHPEEGWTNLTFAMPAEAKGTDVELNVDTHNIELKIGTFGKWLHVKRCAPSSARGVCSLCMAYTALPTRRSQAPSERHVPVDVHAYTHYGYRNTRMHISIHIHIDMLRAQQVRTKSTVH